MELSILLLKKIVVLLSIVLMGFLSVRTGRVRTEESTVLSRISIDWLSPCSLISSFLAISGEAGMRNFLLTCAFALGMILFYIAISYGLRNLFRMNPSEQCSLMFTNSASMALPMTSSLLGPEYVIYCSPHMGFQNVFIFTLMPLVLGGKSEGGWKKVVFNRNVWAILIGFGLFMTGCPVPELIKDILSTVGGIIGPFSMLMIGILMGGVNFRELFRNRKLYLISFLRLIALPLIAILLIRISGVLAHFPEMSTPLMILVLCFSSPVAALTTQMSDLYRSHEEAQEASSINVMTTLLCSLTMPLMIFIYQLICM